MTVITFSRQLGSYSAEIATRVAQALDLRLIDAATINQAAQKAGVPRIALAELENEAQQGPANQVLKALRTMPSLGSAPPFSASMTGAGDAVYAGSSTMTIPFAGLFSPTVPPISASLEGYVRMVGLVIRGLAHEGNVLILGRGGQVLLQNHPGALHVQIVAPFPTRVKVIMARYGLNKRDTQNRVRASDRARLDYLRRYHDADWLDPTLYHLVINTGRFSIDTAVALIIAAQQAIKPSADSDSSDEPKHEQ